jgi:hypothetical protein
MTWIKFSDTLPPLIDDILIWNPDKKDGGLVGFGWTTDADRIEVKCNKCCPSGKHMIEIDCIILQYYYSAHKETYDIIIEDVVAQGWLWHELPENPVDKNAHTK